MGEVDYTKLEKALASYSDAVDLYRERLAQKAGLRELNVYVAAIIQNFEFTIELAWKLIQKRLIQDGVRGDAFDTKGNLFKVAFEAGLVDDSEKWHNYYLARNLSAHTYGDATAQRVFEMALGFLDDAKQLNEKLTDAAA
jgi:nucleotidyltransferase substrate binding protein (TIGR01987 family)